MTDRRTLPAALKGVAALGGLGVAAGSAILWNARHCAPYRPELTYVSFPVPEGHAGLAGLRIGYISDVHIGPRFTAEDFERGVNLIASRKPDLMLLGGDYVSEATRYVDDLLPVLKKLACVAPLGTIAVLGNHDLSGHGKAVTGAMEAANIRLLRNEVATVEYGGDMLYIAGTDDTLMGEPLVRKTFEQVPEGAAVLSLWHEAQEADLAAELGAFAQLSGHSHGGQVRIPVIGPLVVPSDSGEYVMGLHDASGMPVYTSRGLGVYRPPVRFMSPPEVTLVTLTAPGTEPRAWK